MFFLHFLDSSTLWIWEDVFLFRNRFFMLKVGTSRGRVTVKDFRQFTFNSGTRMLALSLGSAWPPALLSTPSILYYHFCKVKSFCALSTKAPGDGLMNGSVQHWRKFSVSFGYFNLNLKFTRHWAVAGAKNMFMDYSSTSYWAWSWHSLHFSLCCEVYKTW